MTISCTKQPECTVAATGKCLLLNDPKESCPNYRGSEEDSPASQAVEPEVQQAAPDEGSAVRHFFAGYELGISDATELMRARYGTMIAVLGQYDVGKTCFLSSLYLMTASRKIGSDLVFAGSLTLNGFEARARRLREWNDGALPKQLADHTVLSDERTASLLHLALRETNPEGRRFDLLITDLPGEWSTDLVKDAATANRFDFIHRADAIVITLDGPLLKGSARHGLVDNAKLLITRLADTLNVDRSIPIVLMITKSDELGMIVPSAVSAVEAHAKEAGFLPKIVPVAAVSRTPNQVRSGAGVMEVVEYVLARNAEANMRVPRYVPPGGNRHFGRIRG